MDKELIDEIRNVLNFMEEFDTLVGKAQETDDTEWENDLYALFSHASHDMRECVSRLFGEEQEKVPSASGEEPF